MTTTTTTRTSGRPAPAAAPLPTPTTPGWWRSSTRDALVVSLLLVAALWAYPHGVPDLAAGPAAALTSLGRLTGLIASDLLLVQVLLMARVPMIERAWGQDRLARTHRLVGFGSFTLMLAHIALIGLGYAGADGRGYADLLGELWNMTWNLPGMLLATAGSCALVLVVVTSIRAARRRLRYESWHLLHLYAYVGVGLALPHQLWTGADFLANPLAVVYWWTAWATAAAAVLVFRVGLPLYRTLRHQLVVHAVVPEAPGVFSILLTGRRLEEFGARAGQFLVLRFLVRPGASRAHPYSLSAAPAPGMLRITVKDLGDDSGRVPYLRAGTRVLVEGPYGRLTGDRRSTRKVLLLGAGIGITPLRALAEELPQGPGDVVVVHRVRTPQEAIFGAEFDHLARTRGLRAVLLPGPRTAGSWAPAALGVDGVAALRTVVPDIAEREVYVCGPDDWMAAALDAAQRAGVPAGRLHAERFTW